MAVQLHHPKGGERMPITVTFHFRGYTVTIRIKRWKPPPWHGDGFL